MQAPGDQGQPTGATVGAEQSFAPPPPPTLEIPSSPHSHHPAG